MAPLASRLPPPAGGGAGLELISLKNFRSYSISAQIRVVAGSMKPPNMSLVMGCAVRVASIVTGTACAATIPERIAINVGETTHFFQLFMSICPGTSVAALLPGGAMITSSAGAGLRIVMAHWQPQTEVFSSRLSGFPL